MDPFPPPRFICFISSKSSSVFLELPPEKTTILLELKAHFLMWEQLCGSLSKEYLGALPTDTAGLARD